MNLAFCSLILISIFHKSPNLTQPFWRYIYYYFEIAAALILDQ